MLKRIPLAPFALAMFPILAMLASNAKEVSFSIALRPLAVSLVVALLLLILFRLILKRWDKAALVTSFLLVLFYSYGQVFYLLEVHPVAGVILGRHRYLMILYAGVLIVGLWGIIFKLKNNSQVLFIANVISLTLLAMPVVQLIIFSFQVSRQQQYVVQAAFQSEKPLEPNLQTLPDVY
jgi:hypothetical protein